MVCILCLIPIVPLSLVFKRLRKDGLHGERFVDLESANEVFVQFFHLS